MKVVERETTDIYEYKYHSHLGNQADNRRDVQHIVKRAYICHYHHTGKDDKYLCTRDYSVRCEHSDHNAEEDCKTTQHRYRSELNLAGIGVIDNISCLGKAHQIGVYHRHADEGYSKGYKGQ